MKQFYKVSLCLAESAGFKPHFEIWMPHPNAFHATHFQTQRMEVLQKKITRSSFVNFLVCLICLNNLILNFSRIFPTEFYFKPAAGTHWENSLGNFREIITFTKIKMLVYYFTESFLIHSFIPLSNQQPENTNCSSKRTLTKGPQPRQITHYMHQWYCLLYVTFPLLF